MNIRKRCESAGNEPKHREQSQRQTLQCGKWARVYTEYTTWSLAFTLFELRFLPAKFCRKKSGNKTPDRVTEWVLQRKENDLYVI